VPATDILEFIQRSRCIQFQRTFFRGAVPACVCACRVRVFVCMSEANSNRFQRKSNDNIRGTK
jgi:hypothetical protein